MKKTDYAMFQLMKCSCDDDDDDENLSSHYYGNTPWHSWAGGIIISLNCHNSIFI